MQHHQTSRHETSATSGHSAGPSRVRRLLSCKSRGWVAAGLLLPVIGLSACGGTSSSVAATTHSTTSAHGAPSGSGGGSNARSGPAAGGSIGKVSSVSTSGFDLLTSAGEKVTVKEASATRYEKGTKSASASAVTKGTTALVLGTTASTTITATQVIVQPTNGSKASSKVIPFKRGAPSTAKKVGQIPANYKEGSGTIVSGTTANKATEAALAAYAGGIVDRVVRLSNGEYEAHYIGVNWPHHVFVTKGYTVVGAY
jgi:hypothetical protein